MELARVLAVSASAGLLAASAHASPLTAAKVTPTGLARAIKASAGPPRPRSVTCRRASRRERAAAPFGNTRRPLFTCLVTTRAGRSRYVVQVLRGGCFVAEDRAHARAIYGCGAARVTRAAPPRDQTPRPTGS